MPTPFYHLNVAEDILHYPGLAEELRSMLTAHRCEFLFGNTAPDVQVVSGQPRDATHFFLLPFQEEDPPPWVALLQAYPKLGCPDMLPQEQTAFLAGYLCHLQADWLWVRDIFAPVFGPGAGWSSFRKRLYLHNVLRAYLDQQILSSLPEFTGLCLDRVSPYHWLPFVEDRYLVEWRNEISQQLLPGAAIHTVDVFAQRAGIAPEEFYHLLAAEERMEQEVFVHVSREQLDHYRQSLIIENIDLLQEVLIHQTLISQESCHENH